MHALWIGIAIWVVFLLLCYLYSERRKHRLQENPPSSSPQEVWDSLSPEAKKEALRRRNIPWGGGMFGSGS